MKLNAVKITLGLIWAVAFLAGLYGLALRVLYDHELANYGSYVPWGLWVAQYTYFVGLSAGAFLLSSLVYVFGVRRLEGIGKLALFTALITMLCALLIIWLDLGQPLRFWKLFVNSQPTSVMSWMVWFYSIYVVVVTVMLWVALRADLVAWSRRGGLPGMVARVLRFGSHDVSPSALERDRRLLRVIGALGVVLAIIFPGGSGALFGVIGARPYWNTALYPILFLTSAMASGAALLAFVAAFFWPEQRSTHYRELVTLMGRLVLGLLLVEVLMVWAEFSINLYASIPAHAEAYRAVLFGPFWWVFWIGQILLGIVLPMLILVIWPRVPKMVGTAGLLAAAMFIAVRANVVIPGQVIPELQGLERAFTDQRLTFTYVPSLAELLVSVFVVSFGIALFFV
ncbi:MAG TPA: NrfD/PsrC family molybdoenzyme membrane anchor subunit, partial [Chloroflexota bacterium]|nr:NrfD/PsrC family molybdoenzyme membrane anchor subunit [Chloroflexota bacterium]